MLSSILIQYPAFYQTSSMLDHHSESGKRWWRTLLNRGVVVLRSLLCVRLAKASVSPLMDFVRLHSSEPASSPPCSADGEAMTFDSETKDSITSIDDEEEDVAFWEEDIHKKLAKGKFQIIADGSMTASSEDEYSSDDDQVLNQVMMESIRYNRELEDWIRFRTPGATFHRGETSGVSTSSNDLSELQLLEMIYF